MSEEERRKKRMTQGFYAEILWLWGKEREKITWRSRQSNMLLCSLSETEKGNRKKP